MLWISSAKSSSFRRDDTYVTEPQAAAHSWSGVRGQPTYSLPSLKSYYHYIVTSGSAYKGQSSYPWLGVWTAGWGSWRLWLLSESSVRGPCHVGDFATLDLRKKRAKVFKLLSECFEVSVPGKRCMSLNRNKCKLSWAPCCLAHEVCRLKMATENFTWISDARGGFTRSWKNRQLAAIVRFQKISGSFLNSTPSPPYTYTSIHL